MEGLGEGPLEKGLRKASTCFRGASHMCFTELPFPSKYGMLVSG